jgi:type II secretory ATPase GspE/PulE/Tfp pilus assembly ATPase PilB-like protein
MSWFPSWSKASKVDSPEPRVLSAHAPMATRQEAAPSGQSSAPGRLPAKAQTTSPPTVQQAGAPSNAVAANDAKDAGLVVADFKIDAAEDLEASGLNIGPLNRAGGSKSKVYQVHASLEGKIVPVAIAGADDTCLLLVNKQYRIGFEVEEVAQALRSLGWKLFPVFQVVVVGQTLLSSISRGTYFGNKDRVASNRESSELYQTFRHIITWGHQNNSADIDFRVNLVGEMSKVAFNINGLWVFPPRHEMPSDHMRKMLGAVFQHGTGQAEHAIDFNKEQQLKFDLALEDSNKTKVNLRWASMAADQLYTVTCRVILHGDESAGVSLPALGYLPDHLEILDRTLVGDGGGVFLTGRVNSGKSTTIDAMLALIPDTQKIITIEDPVEKIRAGRIANTVARQLTGEPSKVMKAKLMNLKRTGFNVLYLGEIRDAETARAAQDVFESGQRLYTTLHAGSAWEIPGRLEGLGIERGVLATPGNLRLLAYQALIPTNCSCAIPLRDLISSQDDRGKSWAAYADRMTRLFSANLDGVRVRNVDGCPLCRRDDLPALNGFRGRTVVAELLEPDEEFCELVARGDPVGMLHYLRALRGEEAYDSPRMVGKSAFDCAAYKMLKGELDPQSVEVRFESFAARLAKDEARRVRAAQKPLRRVVEAGAHHA